MTQWRAVMFGRTRTRWRDTQEEALNDAISRGWASRADHGLRNVYLGVGVEIEKRSAPA